MTVRASSGGKSLNRAAVWLVGGALGAGLLPSCGGDDEITCGSGTRKNGSQCVPSGSAGGTGGTGNAVNTAPTFEGIRSVAPAGETALQVTWNVATDDNTAEDALVYNVYVATSAGAQNFGAPTVVSPPGAQSVLIGGLTAGSEYHIVVRAQDEAGLQDENSTEMSGSPSADDVAPTFDGITGAEAAGATEVRVSWSPGTDDKTPPEGLTYTVRWDTTEGGAATGTVGAVSAPGATSVVVTGLPAAESSYFFNVRASDAAGNAEANTVERAGSTGEDTSPPVFGGCTGVGAPGATKATVSWAPAKDDVESPDTMVYNVYAFTEEPDAETPFSSPISSFVGGTQGDVTGLANDTTYYLVCRAADTAGNEDSNLSFRVTKTLLDGAPPSFGGITGVVEGSTTVDLIWDPATDDQTTESNIVYVVYQGDAPGTALLNPPVARSSKGSLLLTLSGLTSSTEYYWVVRAEDEAGNQSDNVAEVSATTKVSFRNDIELGILDFRCNKTGCHSTDNPQQGMSLAPGFAYTSLVGVTAIEIPPDLTAPLKRVDNTSTNPRDSYLYRKVNPLPKIPDPDNPAVMIFQDIIGDQMPRDVPTGLPEEERELIRLWIEQGALEN